jgi:thiol-disulfide isomerase/thioredoxin
MKAKAIIAIALLTIAGACNYGKEEFQTILSGILPDSKNETIFLVPVDEYFPGLLPESPFPATKTDSLGRYKFKLALTNAGFYQIIFNNYHQLKADIYIEPGDSLFIQQSSWSDDPRFVISGKGSDKLKYLEKDFIIFPKDKPFNNKIRSDYFITELDFKKFIDSIHFERVNALKLSIDVPDELRKHHLNTLNAERAEFLLEHLERRNYYVRQEFNYFFPDENYYSFLDSIDFGSDFPNTTAARVLAGCYMEYQAQHAFKFKTEEEWWEEDLSWKFSFIADQPKSLWKDLLALSTIREYSFGLMTNNFFTDLEAFDNKINKSFSRIGNQRLFQHNITSYRNLAPGKPAPDFELPDSSGTLHRLSDFIGKIVYLDFWGTWCYPCLEEIPNALILQENYKDEPVVFLYVALEYDSTDIARWKEFIAGKNQQFGNFLNNQPFPGVHLVAEKQFRNESIDAYKLNFAPTHVLIDQDGNIVKARAKHSKEIKEEIDKLLKRPGKIESARKTG